jgi:hypothetical protein
MLTPECKETQMILVADLITMADKNEFCNNKITVSVTKKGVLK